MREAQEVAMLLQLIEASIETNLDELHNDGVRVCFMGDRATLPPSLQRSMTKCVDVLLLPHAGSAVLVAAKLFQCTN